MQGARHTSAWYKSCFGVILFSTVQYYLILFIVPSTVIVLKITVKHRVTRIGEAPGHRTSLPVSLVIGATGNAARPLPSRRHTTQLSHVVVPSKIQPFLLCSTLPSSCKVVGLLTPVSISTHAFFRGKENCTGVHQYFYHVARQQTIHRHSTIYSVRVCCLLINQSSKPLI
jgi:hypothetical protein